MMIFDLKEFTKWEYPGRSIYTFIHERHMLEFIAYRDVFSYGKAKVFDGIHKFEAVIKEENVIFK